MMSDKGNIAKNQELLKFLVIYQDRDGQSFTPEQRSDLIRGHVKHLKQLDTQGILFLCGPLKHQHKGMLVLNAKTMGEAEEYVLRDPFTVHRYYRNYTIFEIEEANAGNNYLG